jgi:hypothetical protein
MSEEQESGVIAEAAAQEQAEHSQSASESHANAQEKNWRQMRDQMEELKRNNQRMEAELQRSRQPVAQEEELSVADDDLSTVGVTKKLIHKEAKKIASEMIQRKEMEDSEKWARVKYADYDSVVTNDNLQRLVQTSPELARMLMANPDPIGAYKLLKSLNIDTSESAQLKENQQKPRTVGSVGQASALSQANAFAKGLTPELKSQLWKEMQESMKAS